MLLSAQALQEAPQGEEPRYDAVGRLMFPTDYRGWVFLSSGLNMSYNPDAVAGRMDMFGNTFAPRRAYTAFQKTGVWPDKTVLILEDRGGATQGSINKRGQFQTASVMGVEAHVKDVARFKGGWGFFSFDGDKPAQLLPASLPCYACHVAHGAVDTTFVQFYPTLLPAATTQKTLSRAYLAESGGR